MYEAAAASVRKEQATVKRSNRPRSPLKKPSRPPRDTPQQDSPGHPHSPFDHGPARQAPAKPTEAATSGGTGTGIPPPYVRAAARRAQRLPTSESA
eukprot:1410557-Amphidinium_carterae.1